MAFFLETLIGGLMAGMLYSLVALGFVLIYKASGVFNFAQGAMVLFGALAMARFSEWLAPWTGANLWLANLAAFGIAALIMFAVAWAIENLVLRHLINQDGATLLMATLGIAYFLEGLGQTLFGSSIYKIDIGMPKEPIFVMESLFQGGVLINKEDLYAALIAALLVAYGGGEVPAQEGERRLPGSMPPIAVPLRALVNVRTRRRKPNHAPREEQEPGVP